MANGGDLVYHYNPAPMKPLLAEGATQGWVVLWDGSPGPAKMRKCVALVDGDGVVSVEPDGEWEDTIVTAD